ncbi:MAG TPA: 2-succinyl-5-enolpyruvyl-6-hydroxy-3-cyclohexene-1-carboxylic-acid synthase, partial [Acidimicrobiales bacterium]|nr:2-succinyl-5-enolpyruvyl-6-hydroxy-3-cyclohexene-1-carboxylic-acid synthase [Acidimicrobiales bacterium]
MSTDAATAFGRALVDEWARAGVGIAALAPGSRSTPLALALAADGRIRLEVFLDERSAAYFAVGAAKASGRPAVVLTTSGTAATLLHPAVVEARQSRAPLIACTADRPPELRDTGANQAIDQLKLFGDAVRWFAEVGVPVDVPGAGRYWRSVAARAVAEALGPPAGPVHLNLPFREPLVPSDEPVVEAPGRPDGAPWVTSPARRPPPHRDDVERLAEAVSANRRGVVLAGWGAGARPETVERFARVAGWPVLADVVSGLRTGPLAVSTYDALLRAAAFAQAHRPDLVVRLGAAPTGRAASAWLDHSVPQVLVDPDGAWLDPQRSASERLVADPDALLDGVTAALAERPSDGGWLEGWLAAEGCARQALDRLLDSWDTPFEGRVARDLAAGLPTGATLVAGSSMPVRDLESFAAPRSGLRVLSNRGASGIDGFASTVLGAAAVTEAPVAALCGDLTLLHDMAGLLGAARRELDATIVVLDNDGGGIFSFLPQAALDEHFERLFGTPHGVDLPAVASSLGVPAVRAERADDVLPAADQAL